ncbi:YcfL family protein [Thalassotalea litorea]|uniref:YcfL family protein n=1 Tax=Thalassotalea litorea TaxID=2020715 RepID=UPI003736C29A
MRKLIVFVLPLLLLIGCASEPDTSGIGTDPMTQGDNFQDYLKVNNPELAKRLQISDVKSRTTNEFLEVNLELLSTYDKTQNLQYQFYWYDADGFVIEPGKTPWKSVALHGQQSLTLRAMAPVKNVDKFSLYVREVPKEVYKFED